MSTRSICFCREIIKKYFLFEKERSALSKAMMDVKVVQLVLKKKKKQHLILSKQKCTFRTCGDNKGPDQTPQMRSLIRAFVGRR